MGFGSLASGGVSLEMGKHSFRLYLLGNDCVHVIGTDVHCVRDPLSMRTDSQNGLQREIT